MVRRTRDRGSIVLVAALLLTALVVVIPGPPVAATGDALARIDKASLARLTLDEAAALRSVLELRRSWLVAGPLDALERMAREGSGVEVIDRNPSGRWFEVTVADGREPAVPRGAGIRLEEGAWIAPAPDQAAGPATAPGSRAIRVSAAGGDSLAVAARRLIERAAVAAADVRDDPRIAALAAQVSSQRYRAGVQALESFGTRDATTSGALSAANFLYDSFRALNIDTKYEDFTFTGTIDGVRVSNLPAANVIATIPGTVSPEEVVVVGAHYDSFSRDGTRVFAPGADDNGSGTAALLEIARVLAQQPCDFTVRVIAFGAEEYGLFGSRQHAAAARAAGERILAVLNLDMIGYADRRPEDLDIVVDSQSEWLASRYEAVAARYAPLPNVRRLDPLVRGSDHAPFWDSGYSAMLGIEDAQLNNPHYHRATDRVENLDIDFAVSVTRATLAVAADLAQPVRTPAPPLRPSARSTSMRSLLSRLRLTELSWSQPSDRQAVGYHVYRSDTPHGSYQRLTSSPVTTTSFNVRITAGPERTSYYVVTALDAAGRESNYSVEVDDATRR